jgi:Zinc carboxypeptidase
MNKFIRVAILLGLWAISASLAEVRASIDFTHFHTPAQMNSELTNLATTHSSIAQIFTIGNSVEGRPIRGIKISSAVAVDDAAKGDVVFIALQHAREWIAAEMALYLAEYLVTHYSTDPALQACMNNLQIWIIPVANPDGYVFSAADPANRLWRKNRRNNGDGTFGVDINRNFSYEWGLSSGSSGITSDDTYRGPSAFSEPEAYHLRDFVQARHNPRALMSYHSAAEVILRSWRYTNAAAPGESTLAFVQQDMINRIAAVHGEVYGTSIGYNSSGSTLDYFWGEMRTIAVTPELRGPSFDPSPSQIIPNNEENLPAALSLIKDAGCRTLWIKDYSGDTGSEPSAVWLGDHWSHAFWVSPDIWADSDPPTAGSTVPLHVRVHNDGGSTFHASIVRAYYTDPGVSLEFPNPDAVLIGEQTVDLPPGDTTLDFSWHVPSGTNVWGEHHWCVGAVVTHADDKPLTTQIQRTSNIGGRNFQTVELELAAKLFVGVKNFLRVPAEFIVRVDPKTLPRGWRVEIPAYVHPRKPNRKALLLGLKNNILEPGENFRQPIRIVPPANVPKGSAVEINISGVLRPLAPGKRIPVGNGYTFRVIKR